VGGMPSAGAIAAQPCMPMSIRMPLLLVMHGVPGVVRQCIQADSRIFYIIVFNIYIYIVNSFYIAFSKKTAYDIQ